MDMMPFGLPSLGIIYPTCGFESYRTSDHSILSALITCTVSYQYNRNTFDQTDMCGDISLNTKLPNRTSKDPNATSARR